MSAKSLDKSAEKLQQEIDAWKFCISGVACIALIWFAYWFVALNGQQLSDKIEHWGQFGDFMGGLMNPLVAFAAFFWLTRSVQLQKRELEETRRALEESSAAQQQQAEQGRVAVRLDALVAAHAMNNNDIDECLRRRRPLDQTLQEGRMSPAGLDKVADKVASIDTEIAKLVDAQKSYRGEVRRLLDLYPLTERASDNVT
ncbi:MAG: hypothetical protein EOP24_31900 [Hyphomicrobiales bacterium]|nr:MAG: hypothetical protein EOP24_31900 [Hyphomicrobiales bacterium]